MLPIPHLSYSSLRLFLTDKYKFHKNYILGEWDNTSSTAMNVGTVMHAYLEHAVMGSVDWDPEGKIQSKLQDSFFLLEKTKEDEKISTPEEYSAYVISKGLALGTMTHEWWKEKGYEAEHTEATMFGDLPLPEELGNILLKCKVDLITKDGIPFDWKTCSTFTKQDNVGAPYKIQAYFILKSLRDRTGNVAPYVSFVEVKKSKNKDGSPQIQEVIVTVNEAEERAIETLIFSCLKEMVIGTHYPNPFAQFGGETSWNEYLLTFKG